MLYAFLTVAIMFAAALYPFAPLAVSWITTSVPVAIAGCYGYRAMRAEDRWTFPIFKPRGA